MKTLILLIALSLTALVSAAEVPSTNFMSLTAQNEYLAQTAKKIRRSYWVRSYEDVSSKVEFMAQDQLDGYFKSSNRYEENLGDDEIERLYQCSASESCVVYLVTVSSSYYSGYGIVAHFILLDTSKAKHEEISHVIYAE